MAQIPESCSKWQQLMSASTSARHRAIVANLAADECLDTSTIDDFFNRLAAFGTPSTAGEAYQQSFKIVQKNPDTFTCTGLEAEPGPAFSVVFRIEDTRSLIHRLPDECRKRGYTYEEGAEGASVEDLIAFTDEYDGPVNLGNALTIVWTSEWAAVEPLVTDLGSLLDRLGVPRDESGSHVILCAYKRTGVAGTIHVPRALDAIDQEHWHPNNDCSARWGWTRPITRTRDGGFPELVHRSCSVIPDRWKLAILEP